jgi:glycosyltransferase involved in cell wall biosynthesis
MKILFLNNFYYLRGGSERVLFDEMRLLRSAGHETAIYARAHEKNEPAQFQEFFPAHLDLESTGLSLKSAGTARELIYSGASRRGLREVLARFRPDIVHAHNIYGRLTLSLLDELKASGIPVVMTLHDLKLLCPSYLMLNAGKPCERCRGHHYYHALFSRCHRGSYPASLVYALESSFNHLLGKYRPVRRFIAPSDFLREKCVEHGWDRGRFATIPNCIGIPEVAGGEGRGEYLLYFGRLSREKGVGTLLKACRALERPVPLLIVGEGPERAALEREALDAGTAVSFAGYLSGSALSGALAGARVVVIPSECFENAPLSLLEAFAAGKPVLGARSGGISEMIIDGVNGFLFEPGDAASLAEALNRFLALSDPAAAALGANARARAERDFSEKRHLAALLELYQQFV